MPDIATALKEAINKLGKEYDKEKEMQQQQQQTELHKLANDWHADDATETAAEKADKRRGFPITTNTSRALFDFVKQNPYKPRKEIVTQMLSKGFKESSIQTLITQMHMCGTLAKDTRGLYYANGSEYRPVKLNELRAARRKKSREKAKIEKAAKAQGLAGLQIGEAVATPAMPVQVLTATAVRPALATEQFTINTFDADKLLSTLSFTQTIELYKKLKAMLGDLQ